MIWKAHSTFTSNKRLFLNTKRRLSCIKLDKTKLHSALSCRKGPYVIFRWLHHHKRSLRHLGVNLHVHSARRHLLSNEYCTHTWNRSMGLKEAYDVRYVVWCFPEAQAWNDTWTIILGNNRISVPYVGESLQPRPTILDTWMFTLELNLTNVLNVYNVSRICVN